MKRPSLAQLTRAISRPSFWFILALMALITVPHYRETLQHPAFLVNMIASMGLSRHAFERIAYLIPIIWSGFLFGWKGSLTISAVALACMLPRAIYISPVPTDALFETATVFFVGNLTAFTFQSLRKERERRVQLDALNRVSSLVSQSLDLSQILNSSMDNIMEVMGTDAVFLYLLDEERGELTLVANQWVLEQFAPAVASLRLGEGLNGMVAKTGQAMTVEDVFGEPRQIGTTSGLRRTGSQLIAPLKSKGKILGTICVATSYRRQFRQDEVALLTALGNQIGVAFENARLYQQERQAVEQLLLSEERYRQLFENAHDAIWLHDMDGNIILANEATARLTGYPAEQLSHMNVRHFLTEESLHLAQQIRDRLLSAEPVTQPYEQKLVTKQGTEAVLKLTTHVVRVGGKPVGFQHIARDITEEKRMQENLRFYLGQITRAQEEERTRIARELHDETIQELVVLSRQLDELVSRGQDGFSSEKRAFLEQLQKQAVSIMQGVRRLSQDLRPPTLDRLGLIPALEWLAADVESHSGIAVEVRTLGNLRRLPAEVELVLFRIVQEALRNIWKHSRAVKAEITAEFEEKGSRITVKDDGLGFDLPHTTGDLVKQGRLGLAGMHERIRLVGGSLSLESTPGKGTTVIAEAPV